MTVVAIERLSSSERLALRASLDAIMARDNTYQATPVGAAVARYLKHLEWKDAAPHTIANREGPLRLLALEERPDGSPRDFADYEGREGARLVEAFLIARWGGTAQNTRANRLGVMRSFFRWAFRDGLLEKNPMEFVEEVSRRGRRRDAHPRYEIIRLLSAQPRRDRLALLLMVRQALRKGELRQVRLGHFDFANRGLNVLGKGSKFAVASLFRDVAVEAESYAQERAFDNPDGWRGEYLLFPRHAFKRGTYPAYTWDERLYRDRPLSSAAMQTWWRGCLDRAGLPAYPMHELRHTAATWFHNGPARGDYEMTKQFLRHAHASTTAEYVHSPVTQLHRITGEAPDFAEEPL